MVQKKYVVESVIQHSVDAWLSIGILAVCVH